MANENVLNYPVSTKVQEDFWGSNHKCNRLKAIIAFSLDLENANDNLGRYDYSYHFRKRALRAFGSFVNTPAMTGIPFSPVNGMTYWEELDQVWTNANTSTMPRIVAPIDGPATVYYPQPITLTIVAAPATTMTYQWQKFTSGTWSDIAGATAATYNSGATSSADAGTFQYRVKLTNTEAGKDPTVLISPSYQVVVMQEPSVAPVITAQPTGSNIQLGQPFTLSVTATSTAGTLSYLWQELVAGVWTNNATHFTASWTSGATTATGTRPFRVIVTNTEANKSPVSVTSATANVVISAAAVSAAPVITTQPASQSVHTGDTVTLKVVATGSGTLSYQWYSENADETGDAIIVEDNNHTGTKTATLVMKPASTSWNSKLYYCKVTNTETGKAGSSVDSAPAKITVAAAVVPAAAFETASNYDVFVGGKNPHLPFKVTPANASGYTVAYTIDAAGTALGATIDADGNIVIPAGAPDNNFSVSAVLTNANGTTKSDSSGVKNYEWSIDLNFAGLTAPAVGTTVDAKTYISWPSSYDHQYNFGSEVHDTFSLLTFEWHSDDESVATVDANGIITCKSSGNCRIYFNVSYPLAGLTQTSTGHGTGSASFDVA